MANHAPAGGPVLVLAATGTHGGAVARALLSAEIPVAALVRDPSSDRSQALAQAGATLVRGDLLDVDSLTRAFADAAAVYAVTTPFAGGAGEEERQGEAIIAAARAARLPWLLLASVASADRAPVPHFESKARIERSLAATDLAWTVVAPSYFFENILGSRDAIREGRLPIALPVDTPLHQVALRNLGELVVAVLARREEHLGTRVEVAADAPTPRQMAAALGVEPEELSIESVRERNPDLAAMYEFLRDPGYGIDTDALRARYPEVPWLDFRGWAAGRDWDAGSETTAATPGSSQ